MKIQTNKENTHQPMGTVPPSVHQALLTFDISLIQPILPLCILVGVERDVEQ